MLELRFAAFAVAQRLLELTDSDLIEAHRYEVVRGHLTNRVCFFDKLVALLGVFSPRFRVLFNISQVELMACEDVHGADSCGLIFEKMPFLDPVVEALFFDGLA